VQACCRRRGTGIFDLSISRPRCRLMLLTMGKRGGRQTVAHGQELLVEDQKHPRSSRCPESIPQPEEVSEPANRALELGKPSWPVKMGV